MDLIKRFYMWLVGREEDSFREDHIRRRNRMSNPGDKDYDT